uniref:Uncharacterized protein n=1 Tax=Romanomermis culicivorax TaxID=13658 RepID=A0A915JXU2_ROMCU
MHHSLPLSCNLRAGEGECLRRVQTVQNYIKYCIRSNQQVGFRCCGRLKKAYMPQPNTKVYILHSKKDNKFPSLLVRFTSLDENINGQMVNKADTLSYFYLFLFGQLTRGSRNARRR